VLCYQKNLENIQRVEQSLEAYKIAGCFRKIGYMRPMPEGCSWHYSGTFFWFRLDTLKSREMPPMHKYGAEGWPGMAFDLNESDCLWADDCRNLYNHGYLKRLVKTDGRAAK
jgi:hypothetical protein